ncbi:Ig-like domain-containing protein [Paenibacillus oryzisoli]|uniref:SLH domain-containing protein n=1 Tax=Paenibacillus oryzisoli TaxID=1850517 RepID=A0A198A632_9BACL|nr:Ig-like domain-containing protein [Paenibacillus oryzisoli]OAS16438.1 hypothetical protein A8708_20750 [Paenibacillus oryzisoli]
MSRVIAKSKIVCAFLVFALLAGLCLPVAVPNVMASSDDVFVENFDTNTLGVKPANWTGNPPAADAPAPVPYIAKATVENLADYPSPLLKFEKNGKSTGNLQIERAFAGASSQSVFTYKVRAEQTSGTVYLPSPKSGATAMAKFAMNGGNFQYMKKGASTWTTIQAFTSATWYEVKLLLNSDTDTFDVYINNERKLTNEPMAETGSVTSFYLGLYKDTIGTAYFDDFHIYSYVPAISVAVTQAVYEMNVGTSQPLIVIFTPPTATNQSLTWSSSNTAIATVTSNGVVTGIAPGTANITAKAADQVPDATYVVNVNGITPVNEEAGDLLSLPFDAETTGSKPTAWKVPAPSAAVSPAPDPYILAATIGELAGYPGKMLKLEKNGKSTASYNIEKTITGASSKVTLTYKFRGEQTDAVIYLPSLKSGATGSSALKFALNAGQFSYMKQGAAAWTNIQPFTSGEWYEVKLMLDTDADVFDFYINGNQKLSREPYDIGGVPSVMYLGVYKDSIGTAFFDEFQMYSYHPAISATMSSVEFNLAKDASWQLPLLFIPANATVQSAIWTSSEPAIASVDNKGVVLGLQPGTTLITAQPYENIPQVSVTVHVYEVPITGISIAAVTGAVPVRSRQYLQATLTPVGTTEAHIVWGTANAAIATVDSYGELTAIGAGTTTVYATNKEGTIQGQTNVTVVNRSVANDLYVSPTGDDTNPGTLLAPFKTIQRAQTAVRGLNANMQGDINIYLREGTYTLSDTLRFNETDSGSNGYFVTYHSYPGEHPMISGGQTVTGWNPFDSEQHIYRAFVGTNFQTRQLYVNGVRAIRARSEGGLINAAKTATGYTSDDTMLANYHRIGDLEMVFNDLWSNSRVKVESVNVSGSKTQITMKNPGWTASSVRGLSSVTVPVYYENAYELLDQEGEWYFDPSDGYLYYKPRAWEDLATAQVTAPVLEQLVSVIGQSADLPVRNLQFQGLKFMYTTWMRPSTDWGHSDAQNNYLRYAGTPDELPDAAIEVELANTVNFIGNDFAKLGITGLIMQNGVQNSLIEGNRFYDISGSAISVGQPISNDRQYYNPADHRMVMKNNDILNNLIYDIGIDFKSASAISAGYPLDMDISHNEIYNIPYSGTHIGYGWDKNFDPVTKNIKIQDNMIYDLMGKGVRDGGAIYSLGTNGANPQDKNLVSGNYIRNQMDDSAVLYADQSSAYWRYENNVIDLKESKPWHGSKRWAQAWTNLIHDLDFVNNYTTEAYYVNIGINNTFEGTKVVPDANWPEAAKTIIAQAGIQPAYQDLQAGIVSRWSTERLSLNVGSTSTVKVLAHNGKDQPLSLEGSQLYYKSKNSDIATVDAQGQVTGISTGSTKVVIYIVNGAVMRELEADIYVGDVLTDIRLTDTTGNIVHVEQGTTTVLHAFGNTSFGNRTELDHVTFTSLTPEIATVSSDGTLTTLQAGSAVLLLKGDFLGQQREGYYYVKVWNNTTKDTYKLRKELGDLDSWYVYPTALNNVQSDTDSITITTPNSGHAVYQGRTFMNEFIDFNLKINATSSWYALLFGKQSNTLGYSHGDEDNYLMVVSESGIELQRYNKAQRTVIYGTIANYTSLAGPAIPNTMLPFNQERHLELGTFNEADGVRIILKVDGVEVFNYLDTAPQAIRQPGYFGLVSRNGSMTFSKTDDSAQPIVGLIMNGAAEMVVGETSHATVKAMDDTGVIIVPATGVTYESDQPDVASVGADGMVEAVGQGTAHITAAYAGLTATFELVVRAEEGTTEPEREPTTEPTEEPNTTPSTSSPASGPSALREQLWTESEQGILLGADGRTTTVQNYPDGTKGQLVRISADALTQALDSLKGASKQIIIVPATGAVGGSGTTVTLPSSSLVKAAESNPQAVLLIQTEGASYSLPLQLLDLHTIGKSLGVTQDGIQISVTIKAVHGEQAAKAKQTMQQLSAKSISDMIEFQVFAEGAGQSIELKNFNQYVERSLDLHDTIAANEVTAVMIDASGQLTFVPMMIKQVGGESVAVLKRKGNSAYSVIQYSKTFADLAHHWSRSDVELLASKLLIKGRSEEAFAPDQPITRSEFAALLVRALGLNEYTEGAKFKDISPSEWYAGAVGAAVLAGLVDGMSENEFAPSATITREQMAVMIIRALKVVDSNTPIEEASSVLPFKDAAEVSTWALPAIKQSVELGLLQGVDGQHFASAKPATRAEAALILKRFLQHVKFINE